MLDREALFHDTTYSFLTPFEPNPGDTVNVILRTARDNLQEALLYWNNRQVPPTQVTHLKDFDYYSFRVTAGETTDRYLFFLSADDEKVWYSRNGATLEYPHEKYLFWVIPGFHTPDWMKGAVMYQIFTDRFRNGDPSNDVLDREYFYLGEPVRRVSEWSQDPDPKSDSNEFYGGDLQGVLDKLDYLQDLGVEVIYFNPLFVSPSSHKYDTQDYDHIDPHFGSIVRDEGVLLPEGSTDNAKATRYVNRVTSNENLTASDRLFIKLVKEAHRRGMKVILDGVFNHCGSFNKWMDRERIYEHAEDYEKGAYVDAESPYNNFFRFHGGAWPYNPNYEGWWDYDTLPKLNYDDSVELYQYVLGIGCKWVSPPFNADGWRLDVAADLGHSPEANHEFWRCFRKAVKQANPNAVILAEHYGSAYDWLRGDQWDSVMNYDAFMEPLTYFLTGMEKHSDKYHPELENNAAEFWNRMQKDANQIFTTGALLVAMNELSNHDHSRFLTRTNHKVGRSATLGCRAAEYGVKPEVMREAVVVQMTWPGAPTIYYGDEVGLCGFTDPDNRRTFPWGREDKVMLRFHKEMIRIHRERRELCTGAFRAMGGERGIIAYGRFNRDNASFIVVNNNDHAVIREFAVRSLGVPDGAIMYRVIETTQKDFDMEHVPHTVKKGRITLILPPRSAGIVGYRRMEY